MKVPAKRILLNLMCCASFATSAADLVENQYNPQAGSGNSGSETLAKYVLNLGSYLGFDLNKSASEEQTVTQELINKNFIQLAQNYVFTTYLGAIPVNAASAALSQIMPNNNPGASIINSFANATFKYQNYSSPASEGSETFTVSELMDQQKFQKDPVSQAVLNILGTPDYSVCLNNDATAWVSGCNYLFQNKVMANVIGPLPSREQFYSYEYNQKIISQLNSNSLLGPLMYSSNSAGSSTGSPSGSKQNKGLTAENQIQEAGNFVRYASGAVTPISLPKIKSYDSLYNTAVPVGQKPNAPPSLDQLKAQGVLSSYFANLRVFAAQSSVGMGNLYFILSKRLPQNQSGDANAILTSQAMSEFNMATWRLFNSEDLSSPNKQWINKLNTASSATVQKEIAVLLAEINYQMYLNRQLQERNLLTNTIMLMQNTRLSEPTSDFGSQGTDAAK